MEFVINFPLFCIVISLMAAVISSVLKAKAARVVSILMCIAVICMESSVYGYELWKNTATTYLMGHYPHPWGNELRFGTLEPLFASFFATVMGLCLIGGKEELEQDLEIKKANLYYIMMDLVLASLIVLTHANDIFTGYVFIEISTIGACGILMIRNIGRTTLASVRYMIFSLIGSGLFLMGVILLYAITGHLLFPNLKETIETIWKSGTYRISLTTAMGLITLGLGIKSGLCPFHFWMPDTYGYATPASGGVLSGLVSKGYIFFLIKLIYGVFGSDIFYRSGIANVLYVLGAVGMVVGSVSAMQEKDLFRMIAFSSAAQIGYIYMGIGISPELGMLAALMHVLTHAVTKPMLFLATARLSSAAGGRKLSELKGAAHVNRIAGIAFMLGALSMIGIPLTMGFVSKYRFGLAAFERNSLMVPTLIVLAISTILNTFYFARALIRLYTPNENNDVSRVSMRQQRAFTVSAFCLMAINILIGVIAEPLVRILENGINLL